MAEPNDYISATRKNFVSNDNEGRMVKKCIVEIQGNPWLSVFPVSLAGALSLSEIRFQLLVVSEKRFNIVSVDRYQPWKITCSCLHGFIDKDLINLVIPDVRRNYEASNAGDTQDNQRHEEHRDNPTHEPSVCKIRRFEMMKYSFNTNEEYIAIKEFEYLNHPKVTLDTISEEEVAETMAKTMEQYMRKTRAEYGSGIARPKIEDKDSFKLKGQFLKELQIREEFRTSSGPSDSSGNPPSVTIYTWLERFNKQKPRSFEKATTPVDAENCISHMEKIFDVIGCEDAFKTRLVVYKFEGNALAWWKAYKQAKAAGIAEEQAKNFQWGLHRSTLNHLMCIQFTDVAQVANAARNYKILH
nr:hypothetical protein [Tanacetum cinerariifolium]